ncbi:MAG: PRC-barrel domain-containing protein [Chloroflexota bacterium]
MGRLGKDLVNKAVVSLDEGRVLGRVQDVFLDPKLESLTGLVMGSQGLLKRKVLLIPRDAIAVLGVDAILVKNGDAVTDDQALPEAKSWLRREKLSGREVDTPGGTKLGTVGDVVLEDDGSVSAFALSRVYVEGPLSESRVVDRRAVVDIGQEDERMTADLTILEKGLTGVTMPEASSPTADILDDLPAGAILSDPVQVEVENEEKKPD